MREVGIAAALALAGSSALALCALLSRPWFAVVFVALWPWLAALDRARTLRAALAVALACSLGFSICVFPWFASAISIYTGAPLAVGWLALLAIAPAIEPQLFAFAIARQLAGCGRVRAALAGACAWVGAEWGLPKLFGDSLGHALLPAPWLRQAADLAGAGGLTFIVLVVNEALWAVVRSLAARRPRAAIAPLAVAVSFIGALALYGAERSRALEAEIARAPRIAAGIVQADIARYGELARSLGRFDAVAAILEAHFELSREAPAPLDLLVWPETVYPTTFGAPKSADGAAFDRAIGAFVSRTGIPLLFGAYDAEDGREYNAAVLLEPDGPERVRFAAYRKAALFPLTERVPAWLDSPHVRARLSWLGTWTPPESGARTLPLALGARSVRVAPLICYDALDPALARAAVREGAELLAMLSNDSWFAVGAGPRLHLAMAAFRSLETHRAQLRATPTGISALVLPNGEIAAELGVHTRRALVVSAPLLSGPPTPFVRYGDWLGPLAALAAIALALAGGGKRARV